MISVTIFRTFYFHHAIVIWLIIYIISGLIENNKRKIRYVNYVKNSTHKYRKAYAYIHRNSNDDKNNIVSIIHCFTLPKSHLIDDINVDKADKVWKKSFLPINFFMIGFICPSLNLLIYGTQYSANNSLFLRLLEVNILGVTILWHLYPITKFFSVYFIETGKLFKCPLWFNIYFFLFAFILLFILNGILLISK